MREILRFWRERISDTFDRARGRAELVTFLLFLGSQPAAKWFPWLALERDTYLCVLVMFCLVFLVEVCFASPYRLHLIDRKEMGRLQKEIADFNNNKITLMIELLPIESDRNLAGNAFRIKVTNEHLQRTATLVAVSLKELGPLPLVSTSDQVGVQKLYFPIALNLKGGGNGGTLLPKESAVYDLFSINNVLNVKFKVGFPPFEYGIRKVEPSLEIDSTALTDPAGRNYSFTIRAQAEGNVATEVKATLIIPKFDQRENPDGSTSFLPNRPSLVPDTSVSSPQPIS
jgi:hypothetical protein